MVKKLHPAIIVLWAFIVFMCWGFALHQHDGTWSALWIAGCVFLTVLAVAQSIQVVRRWHDAGT